MPRPSLALALLLLAAPLAAQSPHAGHEAPPAARADVAERLGEIRFPTSARGGAAAAFQRGVLYLHNFHYPQAAASFRRARQLDSGDAMSAAFEALTYTHAVWDQQDTAAARAALRSLAPTREARLAAARTPRERGWVGAVEALYGDGPKAVRDTAFSRAMARLHAGDPADPEAATFYALSLLGLNQGVREPVAYAQAEAVADTVLRAHPRHPGALHYKIHAVDDPASAARGLAAAKQYAAVATDASHALHMTSHIFMVLGMWDDAVRANRQAHAAGTAETRAFGHGTHWLAYELLQQGRVREARGWLDSMLAYREGIERGTVRAPRGRGDAEIYARLMTAAYVVGTESWDTPLARLRFDSVHAQGVANATVADFVVGFAAARRAARAVDAGAGSREADRLLVDSMLERISARIRRARAANAPPTPVGMAEVMEKTLRAERYVAVARPDSAVALLRAAAEQLEAIPFEFGPPHTVKPPRERAAEILLLNNRPAEALAELDRAERTAPGRALARLRRARALLALGRPDEAVREYGALAALWRDADLTFPQRQEAVWGSTLLARGFAAPVAADTVGYASGDLALRGVVYRPTAAGRHPALVVLHGSGNCWGAAGQEAYLGQLFAARGYVAFFPCRRGVGLSAGQGVTAIEQLRREGLETRDSAFARRSTELLERNELADARAAIAAVRARPDVDAARVGVTGISYGGILTMMSAEADSTLRAAVAFAPAAMNWGWNAPLRERLLAGARRTRVPVMVLQAENDWHVGPTRELPEAVRAGGGDARGQLYPAVGGNFNDGHGMMVNAPDLWRDEVLAFLDAHLQGGAKRR
jgi:dienelactone hydrolase